jgi:hypothetical protein
MRLKATRRFYTKKEAGDGWIIKVGELAEITCEIIDFCCEEMEDAWKSRDRFIGFGEFDGMLNKDCNVNIYHCSPWPEGAVWDEMAIRFCPFCAEPIEIEEQT